MKKIILSFVALLMLGSLFAQQKNSNVTDPEAGALLEKAAAKYQSLKGMEVDFILTTINPKQKPEEDDGKYTTNINGKLYMKAKRFKIMMNGVEIYCDGKSIWSYSEKSKEAQVNDYEESTETFSPTKIFSVYKEGYSYQIKEKKTFQGKNVTVVELAPVNKKVTFFKIDVAIDDATHELLESKIYEKSGVRYIYKISKINTATALTDDYFIFDTKKYPGVKLVNLR
jgi:outer membrane lipoprotein-sorting protein